LPAWPWFAFPQVVSLASGDKDLICPTGPKALFDYQKQFFGLSNLNGALIQVGADRINTRLKKNEPASAANRHGLIDRFCLLRLELPGANRDPSLHPGKEE
jgi:hypothetical protein